MEELAKRAADRSYAKCESSDEFTARHLRLHSLFLPVHFLVRRKSAWAFFIRRHRLSPNRLLNTVLFFSVLESKAVGITELSEQILEAVYKAEDRALRPMKSETGRKMRVKRKRRKTGERK